MVLQHLDESLSDDASRAKDTDGNFLVHTVIGILTARRREGSYSSQRAAIELEWGGREAIRPHPQIRDVLTSKTDNQQARSSFAVRYLIPHRKFGERAKLLFLGIEPPAAEDNAQAGHYRDREINAENAGDLASGHDAEDRGQGMKLHALAHDAGRGDVVLNEPPDAKKDHEHKPVRVTHQQGHADDDQARRQRSDDKDEFQHPANGAQNQRIGNSHRAENCGIHDQRQRGQSELGADEVGQHLVEIVEHVFQKFPLWPRLHASKQEVAEGPSVFQKKDRQQGHDKEKPGLFGDVGDAQAGALRQLRDFVAVAGQERLHQFGAVLAPAMFLAELVGDVAGAELGEQVGQRFSQPRAFAGNLRTYEDEENHDQGDQQNVDHGNGPSAPAQEFLQTIDHRTHQVGEEDGEKKCHQGGARDP